ncbi:MAG: FAD-dependent oxidoreductase [Methylococcaceae bacterium]|nr:MAG: FAD-dependent oxidoreductase [Methylococcaceae bacterium]
MSPQIIIVGGGIAGLWTLRRALALGYDAIALEQNAIGCGQTLASQGILHSGVKYGLDGASRQIATLLKSLPPRWSACFAGHGELDLSAARIHAHSQHLWASANWLDKIAAGVGARAMQSEVHALQQDAWPAALRDGGHRGSVYELAESVVDVKSVCQALAAPVRERILRGNVVDAEIAPDGKLQAIRVDGAHKSRGNLAPPLPQGEGWGEGCRLSAEAFIFTSATGNETIAAMLGLGSAIAQRRPLRQIMLRGRLPLLYGHGVSASPKPLITITSHPLNGETVWYLGGGVAEAGAAMSETAAIAHAQQTLQQGFPRLDLSGTRWASWLVDRAEPHASSMLPDGPALLERGNAVICWPTKLVYAPVLAERALAFAARRLQPRGLSPVEIALPPAEFSTFPWESVQWQS